MTDTAPRLPLPTDSLECRQIAEAALTSGDPATATGWALLAIAAELSQARRDRRKAAR
ncbi:hypothetical protein [Streptomyces sp. NPDC008125]|uniref:hypothetical protein n=1 Tax=Streptomyces sp. NPDC008125 TaxID=3364811 RepID=UPI0036EC0274